MARIQRLTMSEYANRFVVPQFVQNHMAWLGDSEVLQVYACRHPRLFRVVMADRTESIVSHSDVIFVQMLGGTLRNW